MSKPLISIITISYNCEYSIEKTIKSVLEQTYSNFEYIIIDGKSKDRTMEIVGKYQSNITTILSEQDRGISDAFNKGIKYAKGELLFFLNAGDIFLNDNILDMVSRDWLEKKVDVLFYRVKVGENTYIPPLKMNNLEEIWTEAQIPHQGAFISKETFNNIGLFNIAIKIRMDFDFFARCCYMKVSHEFIPKIIVQYELEGTSMQVSNAKRFYKEGLGIKLLYGMKVNIYDVIYIVIPTWIRRACKRIIKR